MFTPPAQAVYHKHFVFFEVPLTTGKFKLGFLPVSAEMNSGFTLQNKKIVAMMPLYGLEISEEAGILSSEHRQRQQETVCWEQLI